MRKIRSRKAVSPVIATVILVAVAITVSVAVAYWMSGISSQYTQFEKVEIQTAVCKWDNTNFDWIIEVKLKNSGTATATLTNVFINNLEVDTYSVVYSSNPPPAANATTSMSTQEAIKSGAARTIYIYIDGPGDGGETTPATPEVDYWQSISSGTTINIKFHSAGGMDYIKLVQLV